MWRNIYIVFVLPYKGWLCLFGFSSFWLTESPQAFWTSAVFYNSSIQLLDVLNFNHTHMFRVKLYYQHKVYYSHFARQVQAHFQKCKLPSIYPGPASLPRVHEPLLPSTCKKPSPCHCNLLVLHPLRCPAERTKQWAKDFQYYLHYYEYNQLYVLPYVLQFLIIPYTLFAKFALYVRTLHTIQLTITLRD